MRQFRCVPVARQRIYYGITALLIFSMVCGIIGFEYMDERDLTLLDTRQMADPPTGKVHVIIKVSERVLEVYNDNQLHKKYRIAVGKSSTPTPIGEWNVVWKDYNWGTGFGTRWMGLDVPWGIYGIHGTNKPWSIGQFASHGCIRMRNKDVEELFEWIPIGTPVRIEGRKIRIERVLKYQTTGSDVAILQMKLKEFGYLEGRADGIYGRKTEEAVRRYQQDRGMEATGMVTKLITDALGI